jgi:uncharacterized protein YndB with AHSA1/START domain
VITVVSRLSIAPSADVGLLIRRAPHDVFEALADPSITTMFWYSKSTGRMAADAELTWEWEMYGTTYLHITETGFTGDADTQVKRALDATGGFTFLLSSLKAALEHDVTLRVVVDAHPPNLAM